MVSDKINFKTKNVKRDRGAFYNDKIHQMNIIIIINIYASDNKDPEYTKQKWKELKEEIEILTIIGGINISRPIIDRTMQTINKEIKDLKNTENQLDLKDVFLCRTLNNSPFKST